MRSESAERSDFVNWKEFKSRIINLGFEEEGVFDENPSHIREATNRANTLLHQIVEPNEKSVSYTINASDKEKDYAVIDLTQTSNFLSRSNKAPRMGNTAVSDYYYVGDTLYISTEYEGAIDIFYNASLNAVPDDAKEDFILDCREDLIPFLELLTAYYMWLDDDERKAIIYYNQFLEMFNAYSSSGGSARFTGDNEPRATIVGGIDI